MLDTLKTLILDYQEAEIFTGTPRRMQIETVPGKATVCIGVRRSGKSTYLNQLMQKLVGEGVARENILYLNFFDDRLVINADIFQFGHSQFPRVRTRLSYELVDSLFILGGVDDFLNESTIDFFLGAMLSFDDNDLASLIPFVGGAIGGAASR